MKEEVHNNIHVLGARMNGNDSYGDMQDKPEERLQVVEIVVWWDLTVLNLIARQDSNGLVFSGALKEN